MPSEWGEFKLIVCGLNALALAPCPLVMDCTLPPGDGLHPAPGPGDGLPPAPWWCSACYIYGKPFYTYSIKK